MTARESPICYKSDRDNDKTPGDTTYHKSLLNEYKYVVVFDQSGDCILPCLIKGFPIRYNNNTKGHLTTSHSADLTI